MMPLVFFLDPVFTSNDFCVLPVPKCCIFGLQHTKPLVVFSAFTDLIRHLPMHGGLLKILLKSM